MDIQSINSRIGKCMFLIISHQLSDVIPFITFIYNYSGISSNNSIGLFKMPFYNRPRRDSGVFC